MGGTIPISLIFSIRVKKKKEKKLNYSMRNKRDLFLRLFEKTMKSEEQRRGGTKESVERKRERERTRSVLSGNKKEKKKKKRLERKKMM